MSKLKNAKKKDKEFTNDQISTGVFDPQALRALSNNRLTELLNECMKQSEDIATMPCNHNYSEAEFKELYKVIAGVKMIGDDSLLRVYPTLEKTMEEVTYFSESEPWNYRKLMVIDVLLGRDLSMRNYNVFKKFYDTFNREDVQENLTKLSYIQNNTAMIQQEKIYRANMEESQLAHGMQGVEDTNEDIQSVMDGVSDEAINDAINTEENK